MSCFQWLVSYPKSGNTWLRMFLNSLELGGVPVEINAKNPDFGHAAQRDDFDEIMDIFSSDLTDDEITLMRPGKYEREAALSAIPLLRKVHDGWFPTPAGEPLFPPAITRGVVYLIRDPRDVAISFAHHRSRTVEDTIAFMADPQAILAKANAQRVQRQLSQKLSTWSGHVESWLAMPGRRLVTRYEDMVANPFPTFSAIAAFLEIDASPQVIAAALEATRFDTLRAAEDANGFRERPLGMERFFRRGVAGGWRDTLTPEQTARIEADHATVMRQFGYL